MNKQKFSLLKISALTSRKIKLCAGCGYYDPVKCGGNGCMKELLRELYDERKKREKREKGKLEKWRYCAG